MEEQQLKIIFPISFLTASLFSVTTQTNRLILMGLTSIAFFIKVLYVDHIEIENPLEIVAI